MNFKVLTAVFMLIRIRPHDGIFKELQVLEFYRHIFYVTGK